MAEKETEDIQHWVEAFVSGEDKALSYFFRLHYKSLCYFVGRLIHDHIEAQDIVAECFVKVWDRRQDFLSANNIKAFLYVSCRNSALTYLKQLKTKSVREHIYSDQFQQTEDIILVKIIESEVLAILDKEIEHLPENYREVFNLIYFEHLKTDEIAHRLGLSVQTVRNYKARAIDQLRSSMLKKGVSGVVMIAFSLFLERR